MRNGIIRKLMIATLLASLLVFGAGCVEWLVAAGAGSLGVGYWLGTNVASGQSTCYRNGEPIDCSLVPSDLMP